MRTMYKAFLSIIVTVTAFFGAAGLVKRQVGGYLGDKSLSEAITDEEDIDLDKDEIDKLIERTQNILTDEEKEKLEQITNKHVDSIIDIDELYLLMQKDDKDEYIKWVKDRAITEEEMEVIKEIVENHKDEILDIANELKEDGVNAVEEGVIPEENEIATESEETITEEK